jgi:hypothetical protein
LLKKKKGKKKKISTLRLGEAALTPRPSYCSVAM